MENKTAEEILSKHLNDWQIKEYDDVIAAMEEYASLQCAEMKEELESWKKEHFETVEMAAANMKELQEEVERLRSALDEIAYPIKYMRMRARESWAELNGIMAVQLSESSSHLKGIALKALSGKESKTDGSYPGDDGANMGRGQY